MRAAQIYLFISLILLSNCSHFRENLEHQRQADMQRIITEDDAVCRSYGAIRGTQPYIVCRMQLQQQHANSDAQDKATYQQWWPNTFGPKPQANCTTTYIGNAAQTHCY